MVSSLQHWSLCKEFSQIAWQATKVPTIYSASHGDKAMIGYFLTQQESLVPPLLSLVLESSKKFWDPHTDESGTMLSHPFWFLYCEQPSTHQMHLHSIIALHFSLFQGHLKIGIKPSATFHHSSIIFPFFFFFLLLPKKILTHHSLLVKFQIKLLSKMKILFEFFDSSIS